MKNLFDRAKLFFSKDREFRSALYAIMGFYPHNIDLYRTAFAHKSQEYRSKRLGNKPLNNERLEFLGDAVLETVVSDIVFRHFPNKREGFLTNTRSKIVSRESLGALAKELGIDRLIQSQTSGRSQKSYLPGNTFEALMGAIYLDRGFRYAYQFIEQRIIGAALDLKAVAEKEVNFKSKLLEWCQKNKIRLDLKEKGGQGNNEQFHTTIVIEGLYAGDGRGLSKKESHQSAAKEALTRMRREVDFIDQIFRAKEKRTAMEANEVFCLPKIAEIEEELAKEGATPRKERNKKESKERKEREIKREEKREEKQEEKQETKGTKKNEKKSEKNAKQERPDSSSRKEQNTAAQEPAVSDTLNEERPKRERKERKERSERSEQAEQRAERSERREKPAQPEAAEKAVGSTQAPAQADTAIASQPTIVAAEEQTTTTEHSSKATNNAHRHKVAAVATPLLQVVEALETAHSSHPEEKEARNIESASRTEQVVPAQSTTVAGQEPCPTEQTFSEACAAPVVACEETTPAPVVDSSTQPLQSTASTAPIELLPPHEEAAQEAPAGRVQQEKLQSGEEAIETPSTPSTPAAATTVAQPSTSNKNAPTRKIKLAYPWPVAVEEEEEDAAQGEPVAAAESATSQEETTLTESAPLTVLPPVEDAATESEKSEKPRKGRRAGTRQNASAFTNTTLPPAEQSHRAEKHERKLQEAREQRAIERARKLLGEEEIVENPIVEIALEPQSSLQETPASNDERSEKNARRRRGGRRGGKKRGGDAAQTAASSQQPQSTDASRRPNSEASLPEP